MLRGAILCCAFIVLALLTARFWLPSIGHWLTYPDQIRPADAIVIYGGGVNRTRYGAELYQRGIAPDLWHTGFAYREDRTFALLAEEDVPASEITYLIGHSTWTDGQAIARYAMHHDVASILVITDWWHSRRAMCVLDKQLADSNIELYFHAPVVEAVGPDNWWQAPVERQAVLSELFKFMLYWPLHGQKPWEC